MGPGSRRSVEPSGGAGGAGPGIPLRTAPLSSW